MGAVSVDQRAPGGTLAAGAKLGRYEILAKLAAGGMAVVYVARASGVAGFERLVAIKVLHANLAHEEEFIKMFLDEARLAARIRHPNVVPTIDISDSDEAGYFIVMDYIEGDHLGQILASANKESEKLPIPVTMRVIVDALGGLGAAHDLTDESGKHLNLVHRDVSPHNIMVGRDGVARLTDFGVAKAEDRLTHTRDGQVKGKLAYMAPEQAANGQTDSRSDLFSMGVIFWECITGRRLFRADSTAATLHKLLHDEVPAPSSLDPALAPLDHVLLKALSRNPDERYQTAEEFAQGIEEAAGSIGGISSLRGVSKAVKQYAAVKLKRDKKLIDDAVHALKDVDGDALALTGDRLSEPSNPSVSEVSVGSLSVSKVSGVFSHATNPGTRSAMQRAREQAGAPPLPPPPIGTLPSTMPEPLDDSDAPEAADGRAQAQTRAAAAQSQSRVLRSLVLLLGIVALAGVFWWSQQTETEHDNVRSIALPADTRPAQAVAPEPVPAVPPAPAATQAQAPGVAPATPEGADPVAPGDRGDRIEAAPSAAAVAPNGADVGKPAVTPSGVGPRPIATAGKSTDTADKPAGVAVKGSASPRGKTTRRDPANGPAIPGVARPSAPKPKAAPPDDGFIPNPYQAMH